MKGLFTRMRPTDVIRSIESGNITAGYFKWSESLSCRQSLNWVCAFMLLTFFSLFSSAQTNMNINVGGTSRGMLVYVPQNLPEHRPLLISLHGMNQDAEYQHSQTRWDQIADTAKFVVVYPRGTGLRWDIGGNSDIDFISAIIDDMATRYKIDRNKVYVSGFSMGGMMSYHVANRIADKVAAIAPVGGYLLGGDPASSSRPIPIIHSHGTADDVVYYSASGGQPGVAAILQKWRIRNACPGQSVFTQPYPANKPNSKSSRTYWGPCESNTEIVLLSLDGKGHWHSNDDNAVHTTREIWMFLRTKSLVSGPSISISSPANNSGFTFGTSINIAAAVTGSSIQNVKFYNGTTLLNTDNSAPYSYDWTNVAPGTYELRAVATDNEGNTGEAKITICVNVPQSPYGGVAHRIPGTIQLEEYDLGGNGFAYYDATPGSEVSPVVNFRSDEDVDIENCTDAGGGYNIGYATAGEWLEYTVNVEAAGTYDLELRVACEGTGRTVTVAMDGVNIASNVSIPNTSGWQSWQTVTVRNIELTPGKKIMRLTIGETDYVNLNYVTFKAVNVSLPPVVSLTAPSNNASYGSNETVRLSATASDPDGSVSQVDFYAGDLLIGSVTSAPYTIDWSRMNPGVYSLTAVATDNKGISTTSSPVTITIRAVQAPFHGVAHLIPGRIEAEEYDLGGEGLGYHEANTNGNEGKAPFRNDEVDIEETGDDHGDYNVGYILEGEWLQYSVEVLSSGVYDLNLRMAADGAGKTLHIEIDGVDVTGPIEVPNTGGWQVWETFTVSDVSLTAGEHVMRIVFDANYMNLNYVEFVDVVTGMSGGVDTHINVFPNPYKEVVYIETIQSIAYKLHTVTGEVVASGECPGKCAIGETLSPGIYFLKIDSENDTRTVKLIKK